MENYLTVLNAEQKRPVLDTEGAVLVTAGAGSGKTRVLTSRIAHLIKDKNVYPYNILAITFTNKAAGEMQQRLKDMVENSSEIWVCTIHKMCVRILRQSGHLIGYDSRFTIYTDVERERVIKTLFKAFGIENDKILKNVKYHIDRAKMLGESAEEYAKTCADEHYADYIIKVYKAYEIELKSANALDFDDLLIKTYELLAFKKEALDYYSNKFHYIHVDEFQDTNTLQYKIIRMLTCAHGNIFAVGDDDQSIYGWRGAQIENILNFEKDFKGSKLYKLEQNYRSTKNILDAANYVIKNNAFRREKRLWTQNDCGSKVEYYEAPDETGEAAYTAAIIKNRIARGEKASDFAVLMRLNALSRAYEQELMRLNIPTVVYGGQKFFDRKEIKDLTAYLRLINNPSDNDAFLRIVNVPKRGIGEKTVETLISFAREKNIKLYDTLLDLDYIPLAQGTKAKLKDFRDTLTALVIESQSSDIFSLTKALINKTGFSAMFEAPGVDNENRLHNVNEFLASVADFIKSAPTASLNDYLASITLSSDSDDEPLRECVTLATVHAVKGLEFKTVFLCGLDDGIMPILRASGDPAELEEERRLMYVAITRAKTDLFLTRARSRFLYGTRKDTVRSRFLNELTGIAGEDVKKYSHTYKEESYSDDYSVSSGYGRGARTYSPETSYCSRVYNSEAVPDFAPEKSSFSANLGGSFARSRVNIEEKNTSSFTAGASVVHPKFGEGTIITVKGSGKAAIADIAFKDRKFGIKQLSLAVAPLTVKK